MPYCFEECNKNDQDALFTSNAKITEKGVGPIMY